MTVVDVIATMEELLVALRVKRTTVNTVALTASKEYYFFLALSFAASALRFANSAFNFSISTRV